MSSLVQNKREPIYTPALFHLVIIVAVSFLGLGFIAPLRALYGKEIGASSVEIGLMTASFLLAGFFAAPLIGRITDSIGYRKVLWGGLIIHTLLVFAYIPIENPILLIALRALEGIASASVIPPARALINATAPKSRQGEAMGVLSSAQSLGILLGPAAGSFLAANFGYVQSFVIAGIILTFSLIPAFLLPAQKPTNDIKPLEEGKVSGRNELFTRPLLLSYLLQLMLMVMQGVLMALWSLFMIDSGASIELIGISYAAFALPSMFITPAMGRLSDRYGRYWFIVAGGLVYTITFFIYGFEPSPLWLVIFSIIEGIASAIIRAGLDGMVADVSPTHAKGRVQANFAAAGNLGSLLGATVSGWLYLITPGTPFFLAAISCALLTISLFLPSLKKLVP